MEFFKDETTRHYGQAGAVVGVGVVKMRSTPTPWFR
jgi:hypothetical protein